MNTEKSLLEQLSSKELLYKAWDLLNKENEDSRGLSGVTIEKFREDLDSNIDNLSGSIKNNTFQFSKTKAAIRKKDNGTYRPLQIPEIGDRVVLKAISILLEEQFSETLKESDKVSFAYQRGKGSRDAVLRMRSLYQKGNIILKADIINFFEEVKIDKLLDEYIYPHLKDKSLNKIIKEALTQKLGGLNRFTKEQKLLFKNAGRGIPQGNPLSPLLSNIYLSKFDKFLIKSDFSLIRYADDFIVIFKSEEDAKKGYEVISIFLKDEFSLNIHPLEANNGKTDIIDPQKREMSFLSIKFDGINIYPSKEAVHKLKSIISETIKDAELNSNLYKAIDQIIKRWLSIYSYLDIERYFNDIDIFLISQLTKKFGKNDYKTNKCKHLVNNVRIKQCKKNSKSFWKNMDLKKILPPIFWSNKNKRK